MGTWPTVRLAFVAAAVCALAGLAALVHPASAAPTRSAVATTSVAGTVSTRLTLRRFSAVGRRVVGHGTVVSTFRNPSGATSVRRKQFRLTIRQVQQQGEMCHILFLELGELDLTLAGLHATLRAADASQPIQLRLQARRRGGILGRLFCNLTQGGGALATARQATAAARQLNRRVGPSVIMRVRAVLYAPNQTVGANGQATSFPRSQLQQQAECDVLHLVLGPLHLDLLGLVVDLNKVVLDLKAIPGTLLGNIFCQLVTPAAPARTS